MKKVPEIREGSLTIRTFRLESIWRVKRGVGDVCKYGVMIEVGGVGSGLSWPHFAPVWLYLGPMLGLILQLILGPIRLGV